MINWESYEQQIINLSVKGHSSKEILEILIAIHGDIFNESSDRHIRKIVETKVPTKENHSAKILVFDIETAPMKGYFWSKWQNNISDEMITNDWYMLCWSAKWLFEDKVYSGVLTERELKEEDDERITKSIWTMIDEADIVISHNGLKFDHKKVNTKFLKYKLGSPSPYKVIDTLYHFRKNFALPSNRLDYISGQFFGFDGKMTTPKGLWMEVVDKKNMEQLALMDKYCQKDVLILEEVYMEIRGWIKPHPNLALQAISDDDCCPVCVSTDRTPAKTPYRTYVNEYPAYICSNCGHTYRERKAVKGNSELNVSVPK